VIDFLGKGNRESVTRRLAEVPRGPIT